MLLHVPVLLTILRDKQFWFISNCCSSVLCCNIIDTIIVCTEILVRLRVSVPRRLVHEAFVAANCALQFGDML